MKQSSDRLYLDPQDLRPLAFDTDWLKENLPHYLWRAGETTGAIANVEILYSGESSRRAVMLYQIELHDAAHRLRRQMYVGYVLPDEQLAAEHERMIGKAKIEPPLGRTVALVSEARMILVAFPNDEKLHLLTEAELQPWAETHLREIANGTLEHKTWVVQEVKTEILRYVPNKRCTTRCRVKINTATGLSQEFSFIAKQLAHAEKAQQQYENLMALREAWSEIESAAANAESKLSTRLPRALAWEENSATVFIEEIFGVNLEYALTGIDLRRVIPAVGEMLANIHRIQMRVPKSISRASELSEVQNVIQKIAAAFPALQPQLQRLLAQLEMRSWDDAPLTLLHGTFRLNHIFVDGDELALIDFDSLRMGHPAYDIANFLSSLYYLEAQERLAPSQRSNIVRHFIEGYAEKAPLLVVPNVVLWFLVNLMIKKQAYKYIKHSHADAAQKVVYMLTLAEATLAACPDASTESNLTALWKILPQE